MKTIPKKEELIAFRKHNNLTQQEIADIINVGRRTYQHWEAGDNEIPWGLWELLKLKVNEVELDYEGTIYKVYSEVKFY